MRVTVQWAPGAGVPPEHAAALVVDVLRATTTLTVALAHGALRVLDAETPEEAMALRRAHPEALLCGERDGRKIAGFDLGNSPLEYGADVVRGRTLVFASTNGSLALRAGRRARRRVRGCFANATAALEAVAREPEVAIVCSGKLGRFSLEDAAFAGWVCEALECRGARIEGQPARLARSLAPRDAFEVRAMVEGSSHGRYLRALGGPFARDVDFCATMDRLDRAFDA